MYSHICRFLLFLLTFTLAAIYALSITSCNEGPPYSRPSVDIPSAFRDVNGAKPAVSQVKEYLGDLFWWDFLTDPVLQELIATALAENYDVKLAAERIVQAQAQLGIALSNQYPTFNGNASYQAFTGSKVGPTPSLPGAPNSSYGFGVALQTNWELDFWGKYYKATDAAKATLISSVEARNAVYMSLVSQVASSYLKLRELDLELEISRSTLLSREDSLELVTAREEGGVATMLDVDQARGLVIVAQKTITSIEQNIALQENVLSLLLGKNPQSISRGKPLSEQFKDSPVPPGLPSSLLLNRPDVREAEWQLIAANANVGVARAAYFPQIVLTNSVGTQSKDLTDLFSGPSFAWNFLVNLTQPIFNAGKIKSQVAVSESQRRQAVLTYQKTIQGAFREVSDALMSYRKSREYQTQQEALTNTLADQSNLSRMRYEGGVTSYLEVLDTERQYFDQALELARADLNVLLNLVKLYSALGGGWKQKPGTGQSSGNP